MSDYDFDARMEYYTNRTPAERAEAFARDSRRDNRQGRGISWIEGSPRILANGERDSVRATPPGEYGSEDGRAVAERTHSTHIRALAQGVGTPTLNSDTETVRTARTTSRAAWVDTVAAQALDNAAPRAIVTADVIMARVIATGERSLLPATV